MYLSSDVGGTTPSASESGMGVARPLDCRKHGKYVERRLIFFQVAVTPGGRYFVEFVPCARILSLSRRCDCPILICCGIQNVAAFCDEQNNSADCEYDGGDCCSCTCVDAPDFTCGDGRGFQCIDPAAPCVNDDDITIDQVENCGFVSAIGPDNSRAVALPTK